MSSSTPEPPASPLYLRLPALALSLGIAGFLVFQAGVPGCGPNAEDPTTNSPATPEVNPEARPAAESPEESPASAAEGTPQNPAPPAVQPAANAAPEPPSPGNADDPAEANLAGNADEPGAKEKNADNAGNAGNTGNADAKPRFFPASKAMAPLLEPSLIAPSDDPPQAPNAPPIQQAQQAPAKDR